MRLLFWLLLIGRISFPVSLDDFPHPPIPIVTMEDYPAPPVPVRPPRPIVTEDDYPAPPIP